MIAALQTGPNAAVPAALRKRAYDEDLVRGAKKHAAGILHVAPDGDVLLLRRGGVPGVDNYVGHWSLPGGGVEEGESPQIGAARENQEEMGVDVDPSALKDLHKSVTPTGMAFHTFASAAPDKFVPRLNEEHTGYAWSSLDMLPRPMHPAVEALMRERVGVEDGMAPEDLAAARDGLAAWAREAGESPDVDAGATDSALRIAMDRDSVRTFRRTGQLCVSRANISKANVCPYRGAEIPGWQKLGLEKDKIYHLLRDPEELRKAAPSLNGVQLLRKHVPVSAEDHKPYDTVGSIGSNAEFVDPYLTNSLFVNAKAAIDGIEDESARELSPGYHYTPDMTPGIFGGMRYDGVMRDIEFNHVTLVEDGRTGDDVVVGDSTENLMSKPTRFAALTLAATAAQLAPLLAMDQKLVLPKNLFAPLTTKNFSASKAALLAGVRTALDGKLRKGLALDASMAGLAKAIDAFEELEKVDEPVPDAAEKDMDAVASVAPIAPAADPTPVDDKTTFDAEPLKAFLKSKGVGDADIEEACKMLPKSGAADSEETPEEKAAREKKEKAAKDAEMKDMVTKPAMDAAITAAVTAAVKTARATEQGIRSALSDVKPWVGDLPANMAFDSAAAVHRHALKMRGVEGADKLHDDALLPVLLAQPKPGAKPPPQEQHQQLAMDASAIGKAKTIAPGLAGISVG